MKPETALQTLDFVESSGQALHAARLLAEKVAGDSQKVASLIPQRVASLTESGLINATTEKDAATEQLSTHEGSLNIVGNLLDMLGEQKQAYEQKLAANGNGTSVKAASGGQQSGQSHTKHADATLDYSLGGNVGRRRGEGEKSAADMAIIQSLGLSGRIGKRQ